MTQRYVVFAANGDRDLFYVRDSETLQPVQVDGKDTLFSTFSAAQQVADEMNPADYVLRCRGCGSFDSINEVELTPRVHHVEATDLNEWSHGDQDEAFWESSTTLGYGCSNGLCEFADTNIGDLVPSDSGGAFTVESGPPIEEIAEWVLRTEDQVATDG